MHKKEWLHFKILGFCETINEVEKKDRGWDGWMATLT